MNNVAQTVPKASDAQPNGSHSNAISQAQAACKLIAPAWPLDQWIAVNPWWPQIDKSLPECSATLAARSGAQLIMPGDYFQELWESQRISEQQLLVAAADCGHQDVGSQELLAGLTLSTKTAVLPLMTGIIDDSHQVKNDISWQAEITHQISQFCGAYFDGGQASWRPDSHQDLYPAWLQSSCHDRGISWLMKASGIHRFFGELPTDVDALLELAVTELQLTEANLLAYFHSLLLSINGWASWCAYLEWQDQLESKEQSQQSQYTQPVMQLLAIRLAWELVLYRYYDGAQWQSRWLNAISQDAQCIEHHREQQSLLWVWQRAAELAYQESLATKILNHPHPKVESKPRLQAVFCIDVRSEVLRRHLEQQDAQIQTLGFAGFFGLPLSYQPQGGHYQRPQLPGLLAPTLTVSETRNAPQRQRLSLAQTWKHFKQDAPATFTFVESAGLGYLVKLLKNSFSLGKAGNDPLAHNDCSAVPVIQHHCDSKQTLNLDEKVALAAGVLRGMGLIDEFASVVLLVGHGSHSHNNPQRAGLDCGACGGHSGEVNSRALAHLLNEKEVRVELMAQGITIPVETCFIPALHNTTTDEIELFDIKHYQQTYPLDLTEITSWLQQASATTAVERAKKLTASSNVQSSAHSNATSHSAIQHDLQHRSRDWSQVRPEWGLANNAAFIVAPRSRTRNLDLEGRTFLHDYDAAKDSDFSVLEQIITAPMIVTHWINLQYYASVVDNERYGSGNKVLHNVVGSNLGVFEGNGGDLRTGLALQSLHNGQAWMHQALRLNVLIQAPKDAILAIVNRHAHVKQLVDNGWLYLFQLCDDGVERLCRGRWLS